MNNTTIFALQLKAEKGREYQRRVIMAAFVRDDNNTPEGINTPRWLAMKRHVINHGLPQKEECYNE